MFFSFVCIFSIVHSNTTSTKWYHLARVFERVAKIKSDIIIAGDFNQPVEDSECWERFQTKGFYNLIQICRSRNADLVPTCEANGGQTWHDTILIKGRLLNFFLSGEVQRSHDFDTRNPFITKFRVPTKIVSFKTWKVPKDWTTIRYDVWAFHQNYDKLRDDDFLNKNDSHQ